jgi:oxygen-independent coproporphyrinogen-3 oxidase
MEPYVDSLLTEMALMADDANLVHSIYLGGGTPSLLPAHLVEAVFQCIKDNYSLIDDCEITIEVNPGTVTANKIDAYLKHGVNRLSIGMQSAADQELILLNRIHRFEDVKNTVRTARDAGLKNISLDLMFGLPGQTIENWQYSLDRAIELRPNHLSLYSLTIEENTPLFRKNERGELPVIDPDLVADMLALAQEVLQQKGFSQYEISNWHQGRVETQCRHNLQYWKNLPYLGFGAGAHSYWKNCRFANVYGIADYINCVGRMDASKILEICRVENHENTPYQDMQDTMMLGLRLVEEGVSRKEFFQRYGCYPESVFSEEINRCKSKGLLMLDGENDSYKLTQRGVFLGNQVFLEFVEA